MDFEGEQAMDAKKVFRSLIIVSLMGGSGIIIPFISIFVATFKGVTELSLFNSSMLLVLSILVIIFLLVRSVESFFSNNVKLFLFGIVFIIANLISLVSALLIYLVL